MVRGPSAKRYAQAVFEMALEQDRLEAWLQDLETLVQALKEAELYAFLSSPKRRPQEKMAAIRAALPQLSPLGQNLMALLATRRVLYLAPLILQEYRSLFNAHRGLEEVEVVTALHLGTEEREEIARRLSHMVGRQVEMKTRVDPSILGGLIARMGHKVLDGSTRTRLQELKRSLIGRQAR